MEQEKVEGVLEKEKLEVKVEEEERVGKRRGVQDGGGEGGEVDADEEEV